jgi:peptidyl-prolyl cis-trans isomerase B (cyclophilin B)
MGYTDEVLRWQRERQLAEDRRRYGPNYRPPSHSGPIFATNAMSVVALVAAFFVPLLAVILGLVSLYQIRSTRQRGRALAIAAIVLGGLGCAFWVLLMLFVDAGSVSYT